MDAKELKQVRVEDAAEKVTMGEVAKEETPPAETKRPRTVNAAAKRKTETTEAIRLKTEMVNRRCRHCGQTGLWDIYKTRGPQRYIRCRACSRTDSVNVI